MSVDSNSGMNFSQYINSFVLSEAFPIFGDHRGSLLVSKAVFLSNFKILWLIHNQ